MALKKVKTGNAEVVSITPQRPRCAGTTAKGRRCPMLVAALGDTHCPTHDGKFHAIIATNLRRELAKAGPHAVARIEDTIINQRGDATVGESLRAAGMLLDRIGVGPQQGLVIDGQVEVIAPIDRLRSMLVGHTVIEGSLVEPDTVDSGTEDRTTEED